MGAAVSQAGIPEPPVVIFGEVQTAAGQPAAVGDLKFECRDAQEAVILTTDATVKSETGKTSFLAKLPLETAIVEKIKDALTLGAQYKVLVSYNGNSVQAGEFQSPITADRGKIFGPLVIKLGSAVGNPPTIVSITPESSKIKVGEKVTITIVAKDDDLDTLQFAAAPLDDLSIVSYGQVGATATLVIEFSGKEANVGTNVIQLDVSDGVNKVSKKISIEVSKAETPLTPEIVYEFDKNSLPENGWAEIPGGFIGATPVSYNYYDFSAIPSLIPSSTDRKGLIGYAQSNQVSFFYALNALTADYPILIRMTVTANLPNAQIAVVALKGDISKGTIDGSIATHILATSANLIGQERQIVLLYKPTQSTPITPAFQIAAAQGAPLTTILIDRMEIYKIRPNAAVPAAYLNSQADQDNAPVQALTAATPDQSYEMDRSTLSACGWNEIPGGFINAAAGYVMPWALANDQIPSSSDKKGLVFLMKSGEVNFIYTGQPFDTQGYPVLLRAAIQSDNSFAQFALVALKGDLSTGTNVDSSIATNIPINLQDMAGQERILQLLYQPDSGAWITPAIQAAGIGESQQSKVYIDRLEIYRLNPLYSYPGSLFGN